MKKYVPTFPAFQFGQLRKAKCMSETKWERHDIEIGSTTDRTYRSNGLVVGKHHDTSAGLDTRRRRCYKPTASPADRRISIPLCSPNLNPLTHGCFDNWASNEKGEAPYLAEQHPSERGGNLLVSVNLRRITVKKKLLHPYFVILPHW